MTTSSETPVSTATARPRGPRAPEPPPTPAKRAAYGFAVLIFGALAWAVLDSTSGMDVQNVDPGPVLEANFTGEAPPEFGDPPSERERIAYYLQEMATADREDVDWALAQMRLSGEPARQAILHAAKTSIRSNTALVQQSLDYLLRDPRPDCLELCGAALASRDPHVVVRALRIVGAVRTDAARALVPQVEDAARTRSYPIPTIALQTLAELGGDEARDALKRSAATGDPGLRARASILLAEFEPDKTRDFLCEQFDAEEDVTVKRALAEALARIGDEHPREWLRGQLSQTVAGQPGHEQVLAVLAHAADEEAFRELAGRIRDDFDADARAPAVRALAQYPFEVKRSLLREAAAPGRGWECRLEAWDALCIGDPDTWIPQLLRLYESVDRTDRKVAILTLGRRRPPGAVRKLLSALREGSRQGASHDERGYLLRTLALIETPEVADAIIDVMAKDHTPFAQALVEGDGHYLYGVLSVASPEYRESLGPRVLAALRGERGEVAGVGLQHLVLLTARCCGSEATDVVAPYLTHADRQVREAAATVIPNLGGPRAVSAVRRAWRAKQDDYTRDLLRIALERLHFRAPATEDK